MRVVAPCKARGHPRPPVAQHIDRHQLDRIARAVVSGERRLGPNANRLADHAAAMTRNKLAAMGAPGATRAATLPVHPRPLAGEPALVRVLLERVAKHLAATGAGAGATAPSR